MSRRKKLLAIVIVIVSEALLIGLLPYFLSQGRVQVPFPSLRSDYSYAVSIAGNSVSGGLVLSAGEIVNSSYIEVTEIVQMAGASTSASFYVNLFNRSVLLSRELTPELPTHGEYYDLWIGEGHAAGDTLDILNQSVTLSSSGLRFYGWTFFNTLTASNLSFNATSQFEYGGTPVLGDYKGRINIVYDQDTGLMLEDRQDWTVNYVYSGMPQTVSYTATFTYDGSNVRFTYFTYASTVRIYAVMTTLLAAVVACAIVYVRRRRRVPKLELPPEASAKEGEETGPPPPPEEAPPHSPPPWAPP